MTELVKEKKDDLEMLHCDFEEGGRGHEQRNIGSF